MILAFRILFYGLILLIFSKLVLSLWNFFKIYLFKTKIQSELDEAYLNKLDKLSRKKIDEFLKEDQSNVDKK